MNLGYNGEKKSVWDKYDPSLSRYSVPTPIIAAIGGGYVRHPLSAEPFANDFAGLREQLPKLHRHLGIILTCLYTTLFRLHLSHVPRHVRCLPALEPPLEARARAGWARLLVVSWAVLLGSLPYFVLYFAVYIGRRSPRKKRKHSMLNCHLQSSWVSQLHHRSCRPMGWANTCLCISSKSSTLLTQGSRPYTRHTRPMRSSRRYLDHRRIQPPMALPMTPTMHTQHIHRLHMHEARLQSMGNTRAWTRGTLNKGTPHRCLPPTPLMRHRRRYCTTRHLEKWHINRPWSLRPAIMGTSLGSIMTMSPRHCRRHQPARCQRPPSFTHDRLQCPVMRKCDTRSQKLKTVDMERGWSLKDGQSTGGLSRSIIHSFIGYIRAFWGYNVCEPAFAQCQVIPSALFNVDRCEVRSH